DIWERPSSSSSNANVKINSRYEAAVLADHPSAYWRLGDKTCTALDASGHGNIAIYLGKPTFGARPLIGVGDRSVHFDGSNDQMIFRNSPLTSAKTIGVESWIRADALPTSVSSGWVVVALWNSALLYISGGPQPKFGFAIYDDAHRPHEVHSVTTVKRNSVY